MATSVGSLARADDAPVVISPRLVRWPWGERERAAKAIALGRRSYLALEADDANQASYDLRRAQAGYANDGQGNSVRGGHAVAGLIEIGTTHLRTRADLAKDELIRAAQAHGAHPTIAELEAAWSDLIEPGAKGRLRSEVVDHLKPHLFGANGEEIVDQQFLPTLGQTRTRARSDFEYFVESQARDQRSRRWSAAARFGWIVVGAIVGAAGTKLPDAILFLTSHAGH
jgi:hypothetical protein